MCRRRGTSVGSERRVLAVVAPQRAASIAGPLWNVSETLHCGHVSSLPHASHRTLGEKPRRLRNKIGLLLLRERLLERAGEGGC